MHTDGKIAGDIITKNINNKNNKCKMAKVAMGINTMQTNTNNKKTMPTNCRKITLRY